MIFPDKVFFIADTHFGDENIRRYEKRPFVDAADMDNALTERWNRRIPAENSVVFVLGDFCAGDNEKEILSRLNGQKLLVKGNHDVKTNDYYRRAGFCEVYDYPILYNGFWILSHDAVYINSNMPYANIFGHVHSSPIVKDYSNQHYCVSVERINYTPILFEDIAKKVKECDVNV